VLGNLLEDDLLNLMWRHDTTKNDFGAPVLQGSDTLGICIFSGSKYPGESLGVTWWPDVISLMCHRKKGDTCHLK
jgi:hypothetical protein